MEVVAFNTDQVKWQTKMHRWIVVFVKKKVSDTKRKVERVSGWMRSRDKQTKSPKKK